VPERADVAHRVAGKRFDADDVGAEISEQLRSVDARLAGEIDDTDIVER
jgi:hypothetical protein